MSRRFVRLGLVAALAGSIAAVACGKKGPPLPPLVLLPNPPGDFTAVRRADHVDLAFRIPAANTDRSTPADLARVEIYAITVPGAVSPEDVVLRGTKVASLAINTPKDPDAPEPKTPAPKGPGLDQNDLATFSDTVPPGADPAAYRAYVAVGFNARGRRGALSPRLAVPLVPVPDAPAAPRLTYDEKAITLTWTPVSAGDGQPIAYAAYRSGASPTSLTPTPLAEPSYADAGVVWGEERCYEVRAVHVVESVRLESASSPQACITPRDTFAPAPPEGLVGVGSEGAVSLIWTASKEADLAGYVVLRAIAPATELTPVTPAPITDTNFRDSVAGGSTVTYAIVAVDKAGNRSQPSATITEAAR